MPRNPKIKPLESMRALFADEYYICRVQESGKIEAETAKVGTAEVLEHILANRKPHLPKENPIGINPENPVTLPSWYS
ncbi:Epoxide hydrolase 2 [Melia azedarach]|uniref:Epoxide hydrolase 2 n=1 Tax=Melia azedarach TaxID=155640 RepID=A0ACC1Y800_MELAZ|nr:Epoxide hydrolase 2 [Melia azedarach]